MAKLIRNLFVKGYLILVIISSVLISSCSTCHKLALRYKYRNDFRLPQSIPPKAEYSNSHLLADNQNPVTSTAAAAQETQINPACTEHDEASESRPVRTITRRRYLIRAEEKYYELTRAQRGTPSFPLEYYEPAPRKTPGIAITGFVLSLVGLVTIGVYGLGFLLGLAGFICSIVALRRIKRNPEIYKGKGYAITGIAVGALLIVLFGLLIYALYLFFNGW